MSPVSRSRGSGTFHALAHKASGATRQIGGRIREASAKRSVWDQSQETTSTAGAPPAPYRESPRERALRRGYVQHGEFDLKIAYDPDVVSDKVVDTIERGAYERFEGRRSRTFVKPNDRVVELGAGLGFLSALIMSHTEVADYQLVEADPRLPDMMRKTHELNDVSGPMGILSCVATCDQEMIKTGSVEFFVGKKFCASSLMGAKNLKHCVQVPVISLPALIDEHDSNVLICDIEGSETDIFNGTPLGNIERVLMEIHPHRIGQTGVRNVFRNLDALDFVYDAKGSAGDVIAFRKFGIE